MCYQPAKSTCPYCKDYNGRVMSSKKTGEKKWFFVKWAYEFKCKKCDHIFTEKHWVLSIFK